MNAGLRSVCAFAAIVLVSGARADDTPSDLRADIPDGNGARLNVGVGTRYDSNVFFVSDDEFASASADVEFDSGYRWQGELTGLDFAVGGRYQEFSDQSLTAASSIEASLTLDRDHEFGNTRARISYSDASSLINVFDNSGKFVGDQRAHTGSGMLRRLFEINETNALVTTLAGARVNFVDTPTGVRQDDYDFATAASQWEWQRGERVTIGAGLVGSWYNSDGRSFTNEVTTVGPGVSLRYELGETTAGSFEVSYRRSDSTIVYAGFDEQQHDAGGDCYGHAALTKRFERGSLNVDVSRSVRPSSTGRQDISDQLSIGFVRELDERTTLRGSATAIKSTPDNQASNGSPGDRRTAFAGDVAVEYAAAERMTIAAAYSYLWQKTDAPDSDARAQVVMLTLRWALGGTPL